MIRRFADFTLLKHARNNIVHKGKIAPNVDSLAGIARMYVDLAIQAAVREAIQAAAAADQASSY